MRRYRPTRMAFREALLAWGKCYGRDFPWRHRENHFHVLLAEMLLQRTPAWKVERVWRKLIRRYPTPAKLRRARSATLTEMIRPLGLLRRVETLQRMATVLDHQYAGQVPRSDKALTSLPGVGTYVAAAVRCLAFGERVVMVDSVTARVVKRYFGLGGVADLPTAEMRRILACALPANAGHAKAFDLALVDLAGLVCLPARPRCGSCPLSDRCLAAGTAYGRATWRIGRGNHVKDGPPRTTDGRAKKGLTNRDA